jgi:uncharacterized Fe-S cluster-containing protein
MCSSYSSPKEIDFFEYSYKENFSNCDIDKKVICESLKEINKKHKILWVLDGFDELELLSQGNNTISLVSQSKNFFLF